MSNLNEMKRVYAKEEYCVGCRLCEVHCSSAHSKYKGDVIKAYKLDKERPLPGIVFEEKRPVSFALQCRHCDASPCTKACITGAMHKDPETGVVTNDISKCVGCWSCIMACPFGVISRVQKENKVASKCDLCTGIGDIPACVKNCPNGALVFE